LNASAELLLLIGGSLAGVVVGGEVGAVGGLGAFVGTLLAGGFSYCINAARQLVRLGFTHVEVRPAFAAEIEQNREETAVQHGGGRSPLETIMLSAAAVSGTVFASAVLFIMTRLPRTAYIHGGAHYFVADWILVTAAVSGLIAVPSTLAYLSLWERRRDIATDFWAKMWSGRIGQAAFWLGRQLVWRAPPPRALTHRATELVLSMAAESLFENLPESVRRSLGDVPTLVRQLQTRAQRLREVHAELETAIGWSSGATAEEAQRVLRSEGERVHHQLSDAVRALETIRLNLLRLHAGSGTVAALTTELDLAATVSADAERLLAARAEVDRLTCSRVTAPTLA